MGSSSFTQALTRAVGDAGGETRLDPRDLVSAEPVTDARPHSVTVARRGEGVETLVIGAPEAVAAAAGATDAQRAAWHAALEAAAERGERVVGVAGHVEQGRWTLRGLIGFADALRAGIGAAMGEARSAGIQVVMVTGDHPATATSIAREAGLDVGTVTLGSELESSRDRPPTRSAASSRSRARPGGSWRSPATV